MTLGLPRIPRYMYPFIGKSEMEDDQQGGLYRLPGPEFEPLLENYVEHANH